VNQTTHSIAQQERGHNLLSAPPLTANSFGFLQELMADGSVEEIWINQPGQVWFADSLGSQAQNGALACRLVGSRFGNQDRNVSPHQQAASDTDNSKGCHAGGQRGCCGNRRQRRCCRGHTNVGNQAV